MAAISLGVDANNRAALGAAEDPDVLLGFDLGSSAFRFGGRAVATREVLLTAIGGTEAGGVVTIGPHIASDTDELIVNGGFDDGLEGWTILTAGGGSADQSGGVARLISTGSAAGIAQPVAVIKDKAYAARYTIAGGTTNFRIGGLSQTEPGPAGGTRAPGAHLDTFSADGAPSYVYGFRAGAGAVSIDEVSVRACAPCAGWPENALTVKITARAPAALGTHQTLWSCGHVMTADAGDEIAILQDGDGHIRVRNRYGNGTVVDFDLGSAAPGAEFTVSASFAPGEFLAQLDAGPIHSQSWGDRAGFGVMRIGSDFAQRNWRGDIDRFTVLAKGGRVGFEKIAQRLVRCEGDSFMTLVNGHSLPQTMQAVLARGVTTSAMAGSDIAAITARVTGAGFDHLKRRTTIIWDGSEYPVARPEAVPAYLDTLGEAISALGHHRFVLNAPCANLGARDHGVLEAIRDGMEVRWPGHVLDWRDHLVLDAHGAPAAEMFANPETDQTHLGAAALLRMAAAIGDLLALKGW